MILDIESMINTKRMIQEYETASSRREENLKKKKEKDDDRTNEMKRAALELRELKNKKQKLIEEQKGEIASQSVGEINYPKLLCNSVMLDRL